MKRCGWTDAAVSKRDLRWAAAPLVQVARALGLAPFRVEGGLLVPNRVYLALSVAFAVAIFTGSVWARRVEVEKSFTLLHLAWVLCELGFSASWLVSVARLLSARWRLAEAAARACHHHRLLPQTPATYSRWRVYLLVALGVASAFSLLSSDAGASSWDGSRVASGWRPVVTVLQNVQVCAGELCFVALVVALVLALQSLNADAEALAEGGAETLPARRERARRMRVIQAELCDASEEVGGVFAPLALVGVARSFVVLTSSLFLLLGQMLSDGDGQRPMQALWCAQTAVRLIVIAAACARASDEAKKTGIVIHKTMVAVSDPEMREELQLLSLQLMHRQVQFTACDFFPIDYTLLYSIVGSVTTYMVILLQFKISSDLSRNTTDLVPTTTAVTYYGKFIQHSNESP